MRLLLAMATVLMLSTLGLAAHETAQLGPYNASFDINANIKGPVQVANPVNNPTLTAYGMVVTTDNSTGAQITVTEFKNLTDSTPAMYKQLMIRDLALIGLNTTNIKDTSIDGKDGFVIYAMPISGNNAFPAGKTLFTAMYWLDSKNCECGPVSVGTTRVDITSTYPQDITQGLLNSLHIAKGQAST